MVTSQEAGTGSGGRHGEGMHLLVSVAHSASQLQPCCGPFKARQWARLGYGLSPFDVDYHSNILASQSLDLFSSNDLVLTLLLTFIPVIMPSHC